MINVKKECAKEALKYIKNGMLVGLGAGSTIEYLIGYIAESKDLKVKVVTPSFKTKSLCIERGLEVMHTAFIDKIDVAFDGCDEVDANLNALKSGGGIHCNEKLIGSMAKEYILLVDESKFSKELTFAQPVVLEILEEALGYVKKELINLGAQVQIRTSKAKDGATISENGNFLIEATFKEIQDIKELNNTLINICGVVDTSLFTREVTKAIVVSENDIKIISREK